jgi:hypothetical protein
MVKHKSDGSRRNGHPSTSPPRKVRGERSSASGQFVLGRDAFTKVSEVEGIVLSRRLDADLRRLEGVSREKRRGVLAERYGKK